ncbi:MAG: hypothetical protein BWY52_00736 [Chloroflexi bacterium ADurb.Bin325]|nr:MAG: hypothetical protein BWY52_00736 [Chloroflexi bacterium ADurb.Bin325]
MLDTKTTLDLRATPRVLLVGRPTEIRIRPAAPDTQFDPSAAYRVTHYPTAHLDSTEWPWPGRAMPARVEDGALVCTLAADQEEEHLITVERIDGDAAHSLGRIAFYAVEADLFGRTPYKGDLHMHSNRSDGREPPAHVAARCRQIGLDFAALTDHRQYAPSLEAIAAFEGAPLDLAFYPGEEVHAPGNPIHIVNFGGRFSVNDLFADRATYDREVAERQAQFGGYWPHEMWSNGLQVARYHAEIGRGRRIPIVGVSDAHGCHRGLFGWYYTLAFARSTALPDLRSSVAELYSVAVEDIPDEYPRVHGPFRLVKYAHFVLAELMPGHDALCEPEGAAMLRLNDGDPHALADLAALQGRTARYWAEIFAR